MFDLWSGVAGALLIVGIAVAVELVSPLERFTLRSRVAGTIYWLLRASIGALLILPLQQIWKWLGVPPLLNITAGTVPTMIMAVLLTDFLAYWRHRFEHRFFWPVHAVHHSQTELHAANGYGHFLEAVPHFVIVLIPLSLIFEGWAGPAAVLLIFQLLQVYIHSPVTIHFGRLRAILVDNRFHRIHHSLEPRHFDRNFGISFSVWDRLFGTAYDPGPEEWPATGVAGVPPPQSVADYVLFPFARIRR